MISTYMLFERSKWKDANLSKSSMARLHKSGIVKPLDHYVSGINKGTDNILHKAGAVEKKKIFSKMALGGKVSNLLRVPISRLKDTVLSSPITSHNEKTDKLEVHNPRFKKFGDKVFSKLSGKKMDKGDDAVIRRHEASAMRKDLNKKKKIGILPIVSGKTGGLVGAHANLDILRKEKKDTDFLHKTYGKTKSLRNVRDKTGEYRVIDDKGSKKLEKQIKKHNEKNPDAPMGMMSTTAKM